MKIKNWLINHYNHLLKGTLFISLFLVISTFLAFLLEPKDNTKKAGMYEVNAHGFLAEPANTLDVLYMGDSVTYTSFSPMQMYEEHGFTGYVMAVSAQRIYYQYYYLKDALKTQSPKVVVLEANTLFRKFSPIDIIDDVVNVSVPLLEHHDRWKTFSLRDFDFDIEYTYRTVTKGYVLRTKVQATDNDNYMHKEDKMIEITSENEYYVKKIKELCEQRNIKLIIISSCNHKNWNYGRHYGLVKLAQDNNIDYLDLNLIPDIKIDWSTDSTDKGDHLNINGTKKISSYVGRYLSETYNLPNHRQDETYRLWEEDLKKYQELLEASPLDNK